MMVTLRADASLMSLDEFALFGVTRRMRMVAFPSGLVQKEGEYHY
jgi:hypothetical protein